MGCFIIFINTFLDKWVTTRVVGTCSLYDMRHSKITLVKMKLYKITMDLYLDFSWKYKEILRNKNVTEIIT